MRAGAEPDLLTRQILSLSTGGETEASGWTRILVGRVNKNERKQQNIRHLRKWQTLRKNMEGGKGTGVKGRAVSDFKLGGQKVPRWGDPPAKSWRPRRRARQTTREDPHEEMEQVQMLRGRSLASLRRFSKGRSMVTWSREGRENQGGSRGQPAEGPGGLWLQAERGATDGFGWVTRSDLLRPGLASCCGEKQERRNKAEAWRPLTWWRMCCLGPGRKQKWWVPDVFWS